MLYTISSANKISWFFKEIKKYSKKQDHSAGELANWLRLISSNPYYRIRISKNEKYDGFIAAYIMQEFTTPIVVISQLYYENDEVKTELVHDMQEWARDNGIYVMQSRHDIEGFKTKYEVKELLLEEE